jgi:hypothetical protein
MVGYAAIPDPLQSDNLLESELPAPELTPRVTAIEMDDGFRHSSGNTLGQASAPRRQRSTSNVGVSRGSHEALRVGFRGWYDHDDDDFKARTFFSSPPQDNGEQPPFRTPDKRRCDFLLLRALRTGSRALSLDLDPFRGELLSKKRPTIRPTFCPT